MQCSFLQLASWNCCCLDLAWKHLPSGVETVPDPWAWESLSAWRAKEAKHRILRALWQKTETSASPFPCHLHSGKLWHTSCSQSIQYKRVGCTRTESSPWLLLASAVYSRGFSKSALRCNSQFREPGSGGPCQPAECRERSASGRACSAGSPAGLPQTQRMGWETCCLLKTLKINHQCRYCVWKHFPPRQPKSIWPVMKQFLQALICWLVSRLAGIFTNVGVNYTCSRVKHSNNLTDFSWSLNSITRGFHFLKGDNLIWRLLFSR